MRTDKLNLAIKRVLGEKTKKILIHLLYPFRNNFLLFNISNMAIENTVNLNYWDESNNLGDTLAPIIVEYMLSLKGLTSDKRIDSKKHLYAVGSVLTAGIQDATVWGSGVLNSKITYRLNNRKLDIRAVRGPFTKAVLEDYGYDVPEVYGDPAILMPEIYRPTNCKKKYKYGIVLHKDYLIEIAQLKGKDIKVLDIKTDDYKKFVDEMMEVSLVISSSLHGIILAESYGIPAILLKPQVDSFKYYDYYFGTGRYTFPIAKNIKEAMQMMPVEVPNLKKNITEIKKAFPYDLYENR